MAHLLLAATAQILTEPKAKEPFRLRFIQSLFKMTSAAITPGTQPQKVRIRTMRKLPHPLSTIDKGGKNIASMTRIKLIAFVFSES